MTVPIAIGLAACLFAAAMTPAAAQGPRYVLQRVEGGLIRMDTVTGSLSQCRPEDGVWSCRSLSDDGRQLPDEIAALKAENEALKARLAEVQEENGGHLELPSDADLDRLMATFEKLMRRFMDFARSLEGGKRDDI